MLICNGFAQGSRLLLQVLAATGFRRLAVEDPSDNELRDVATAAGLEVVGVPVLESGLDVEALERSGADVRTGDGRPSVPDRGGHLGGDAGGAGRLGRASATR